MRVGLLKILIDMETGQMKISPASLKPLSLWKAVLLFACTSAPIYIGLYYIIPILQNMGWTFLSAYLLCFYTTFIALFIISLILYRAEGNRMTWDSFQRRYRLEPVNGKAWLWALGLFLFGIITLLGLSFTGKWMASFPLLAPPPFFPPEINPLKEAIPNAFMGTQVQGHWGYVLGYFIGWFFNIFGEELLWRGYMLPRQETLYGKWTWVVHGVLWMGWHIFWKWNLLSILPIAFGIPFVVQKTKNTWMGIITHGTMNFIPVIALAFSVMK
jgi:membrane protease YdiL (CAAX protease family)